MFGRRKCYVAGSFGTGRVQRRGYVDRYSVIVIAVANTVCPQQQDARTFTLYTFHAVHV